MTPKKEGKKVAEVLNSCFWSGDLLDLRRSTMCGEAMFMREQLRQEIVDHLSSDALLAITIALAQENLKRIRGARTRITELREAAQNTLETIDKTREQTWMEAQDENSLNNRKFG